ncbi:MAG: serine hydrolase, partial [Cytophagales bacterium]|nr:serine hydrolase [Cytophagales bacterium]
MKTKGFLCVALSAALLLSSCETHELAPRETTKGEKDQTTANLGNGAVFNSSHFSDNIAAALKGKTVGFIASMSNNGFYTGISSGFASYLGPYAPSPSPYKPGEFWIDPRMETAQLSSTITAAALLEVLEGKAGAVTLDAPIFPYLPANWKLGPNVKLLTFRHLLTHVTGLVPGQIGLAEPETDRYENLRKIIANGIPASYIQDRNGVKVIVDTRKQSLNYALMRVLIPYVQYGAAKYKPFEVKNTNAEVTAADYVALVQQLVLVPSGIAPKVDHPLPDVLSVTQFSYPPRFYQYGNMDNYWEQDAQGRLYAGASRWIMKSQEY